LRDSAAAALSSQPHNSKQAANGRTRFMLSRYGGNHRM